MHRKGRLMNKNKEVKNFKQKLARNRQNSHTVVSERPGQPPEERRVGPWSLAG